LGAALMGHKKGDEVSFRVPGGAFITLTILSISK